MASTFGFAVIIAATGVPQQISAEAAYAAYVTLQNNSLNSIAVGKNPAVAVGSNGIQIAPANSYTFPSLTSRGHLLNSIWVVGTATDVVWVDGERY